MAPSYQWATTAPEIQRHPARKNECLVFTFEYTDPVEMGQTFPRSALERNIDWLVWIHVWVASAYPQPFWSTIIWLLISMGIASSTQLISLSPEGWPNMTKLTQTQTPNTKRRVALKTAFSQSIWQTESPTHYVDGAQPLILSSLLSQSHRMSWKGSWNTI